MKNNIFCWLCALLVLMVCPGRVAALSLDTYAPSSRLSQGKWVKISVPQSGVYLLTPSQLRQWGFSDPSKVRVFGYGGARISDVLDASYIDDLPMAQTLRSDRGIIFYGVGPDKWERSARGVYIRENNIYTQAGYYFLSECTDEEPEIPCQTAAASQSSSFANTYTQKWHYEVDRVSPGEAGYLLVGESFKTQPTRKFAFDNLPAGTYSMECAIVANSATSQSVSFAINGTKLDANSTDVLASCTQVNAVHGSHNTAMHTFDAAAGKVEVTISVANTSTMSDCWLDYLTLNSVQPLAMPTGGYLAFEVPSNSGAELGAGENATVWDVTNPQAITKANTEAGESTGSVRWVSDYGTGRNYVAFNPTATLPTPALVGTVRNQDIHATESADMVIFTLPAYLDQAKRIAKLHSEAAEPLKVAVLNVEQVYNEFASGSGDISALRKCMKMLYDRGLGTETPLRYALLLGRSTYDHRRLTSQFDSKTAHGTIPCYISGTRREQLSDNTGFGTDDFIAMLADGAGKLLGEDKLLVSVGRIPVRSASEASQAVDKLEQYMLKSKPGTWRNSFVFLADDGDNGIHVKETEMMIERLLATERCQNLVTKVYVDAYDIVGGSCQDGRTLMYRTLDEGVVWWNFSGHANNHSWTGENMLNYTDINNMYLKHVPVIMAATCDFLRWDSNVLSGGEILYHERNGGCIAMISATRPVYITKNGNFTRAIGRALNSRDADGKIMRLGDIYRTAKNDIRNENEQPESDTNRLRYVLMGDPALRLVLPSNIVQLETIDGQLLDPEAQITLQGLQRAVLCGSVTTPDGEVIEDFNGTVQVVIYDAERSLNTKGVREENVVIPFDQHGDKLYSGSAPVQNGRFTINVAMPSEVADNFRPACINMYAQTADGATDACGLNRDFYVYGLDEGAPVDEVPPTINSLVLNHSSFKEGDTVNDSPMLIADVSDDVGLNLSSAGIGHQMTITVDDVRTYNDVSLHFTPAADGSPSGTIAYPLSALTDGAHSLRLRIWDTSGNSATREISFASIEGLKPNVYDTYCTPNPASEQANFYISHDRPDGELTVTVSVYTLMGKPVWESTVKAKADMFLSSPVTWDLKDTSGRRVPRGIYIYRASVSSDGGVTMTTQSRKLAVTAE